MAKDKEGHGSEKRAEHGKYSEGTHYHGGKELDWKPAMGYNATREEMHIGAEIEKRRRAGKYGPGHNE